MDQVWPRQGPPLGTVLGKPLGSCSRKPSSRVLHPGTCAGERRAALFLVGAAATGVRRVPSEVAAPRSPTTAEAVRPQAPGQEGGLSRVWRWVTAWFRGALWRRSGGYGRSGSGSRAQAAQEEVLTTRAAGHTGCLEYVLFCIL